MAISPPPYDEIDGVYVQIDKHVDAALFTGIAPQDGNARPGQILVDTSDYNVYVGNDSGNVRLIGPSLTQTGVDDDSITLGFNNQNQQILMTTSSTVYVPNNNDIALPIGYAVTLVVGDSSSGFVRPDNTGVTRIYTSGSGGNYVENDYDNIEIPQFTMATLLKTGTDTWYIAGSGLTENYC
jgi:hypothetical protein